ncbi:hypothetical protein PsorP6_010900 [Peronosclerospora sorghi]|uniref:Uncharacterized protein n=1 Tax=Peronosclerospora sorghi TaxID=230839 RepID=A0ACC0VVB5_9STRA|nr:hypothetical protein PsorP6_010900 [Peronosclerospora sorghi]
MLLVVDAIDEAWDHKIPTDVKVLEEVVEEVDVLRLCHSLGMSLSQIIPASMHEFLSWACSIPGIMTPTSRVSCAKVYLRGTIPRTHYLQTIYSLLTSLSSISTAGNSKLNTLL